MRKLLLLSLVLVFAVVPTSARADWADDFDSYATGSGLHGQGGWKGWDNDPAWDAYVTDVYSQSAPNSVEIAGPSDMVHEYSGYGTGTWIYTAWQYVPADFAGLSYFLLLNTYNDTGPYNWSCQVLFDSAGYVISDPDGGELSLITDRWVEIRVEIDLDADLQTFYYDDQMLYQKSWIDGVSGDGAQNIGAVDLFANAAEPIYYDDLSLVEDQGTAIQESSWGRVKSLFR